MEQTHIYQFLGIEQDPIYHHILCLEKGSSFRIGNLTVSLNLNGLYEVETAVHHECFSSKRQLYDGLSKLLSLTAI